MDRTYDVRLVAHADGTFSILQALRRNNIDNSFVPVGNKVVENVLRKHYENELGE